MYINYKKLLIKIKIYCLFIIKYINKIRFNLLIFIIIINLIFLINNILF